MQEYRIENDEDVIMWFQCDTLTYDAEDELLKGFVNGIHILEYCMRVGDVVWSVDQLKEIYRRVE